MLDPELPLPLLRNDMELVSRSSAGAISSTRTAFRALNSVTACWLYAEMPCSTAIAVATASLHIGTHKLTAVRQVVHSASHSKRHRESSNDMVQRSLPSHA